MGKHRRMTASYYTIAPAHMLREMTVTGNCGASLKDSFPPVRGWRGAILASGVSVGGCRFPALRPALKRRNRQIAGAGPDGRNRRAVRHRTARSSGWPVRRHPWNRETLLPWDARRRPGAAVRWGVSGRIWGRLDRGHESPASEAKKSKKRRMCDESLMGFWVWSRRR